MGHIDMKTISERNTLKLLRLISALAIIITIGNCAVTKAAPNGFLPFSVQVADKESSTKSTLIIHTHVNVTGDVVNFKKYGSSIGLLGIGIDAGLNKISRNSTQSRLNAAIELVRPLNDLGLGAEFQKIAQTIFNEALQSSSWLKTNQAEVVPIKSLTQGFEDAKESPVLDICISHHLSPDISTLIVEVEVTFWRKNHAFAYSRDFTYFSDSIGPEHGPEAIAKWAANNGEAFRNESKKALIALVKMFTENFLNPVSSITTNEIKISLFDPIQNKKQNWKGWLLRQDGSRVIFQERSNGRIYNLMPISK